VIQITDPASLVAAAICELARQDGLPPSHPLRETIIQRHERPCGWCIYPRAELAKAVAGARIDTRRFERLPQTEQKRQVIEAQAFDQLPFDHEEPAA
jgi:hypothetical protein